MKRADFYTLTNAGPVARSGYIYDSGRNTYGIDNRGSYRPSWSITDLATGLQVRAGFSSRKEAAEAITESMENIIIRRHGEPDTEPYKKAIADAYKEKPLNQEKRRPIKYGYIIEEYTTTDGTRRAYISTAAHPDYILMDIPGDDLTPVMVQIKQDTPKAYFIDKATGQEIVLLSARNKAQEAPEPIKADETTPAPTEGQEEPQNGPTKPEKMQRYVFRTFTGWTVYDGITSESIITAATDEEAEEKARTLAAGRAYSVNRLWTAEQDAPETLTEAPTTDASPAADTETTSAPEEAAQTEITTTEGSQEEQTRPESIQTQITTDGPTTPGKVADDQSTPGQTTITAPATISDKPGQATITDAATLSDRPTDQQTTTGRRETTERQTTITPDGIQTTITTQGTTTSRTTTRGSPTRPQTAPQRAATITAAQTTTTRRKPAPRAKYKVIQAIPQKPQTYVSGNAAFHDPAYKLDKKTDIETFMNILHGFYKRSIKNRTGV